MRVNRIMSNTIALRLVPWCTERVLLVDGGMYIGTPEQCLAFMATCIDLVEVDSLVEYFHYSETKGKYVYIPDMHPMYIRNVLLKELREGQKYPGYEYMEYILVNPGQAHELVAEALRLWYEMSGVEWDVHRDALLSVLESSDPLSWTQSTTSVLDVQDLPLL